MVLNISLIGPKEWNGTINLINIKKFYICYITTNLINIKSFLEIILEIIYNTSVPHFLPNF